MRKPAGWITKKIIKREYYSPNTYRVWFEDSKPGDWNLRYEPPPESESVAPPTESPNDTKWSNMPTELPEKKMPAKSDLGGEIEDLPEAIDLLADRNVRDVRDIISQEELDYLKRTMMENGSVIPKWLHLNNGE